MEQKVDLQINSWLMCRLAEYAVNILAILSLQNRDFKVC